MGTQKKSPQRDHSAECSEYILNSIISNYSILIVPEKKPVSPHEYKRFKHTVYSIKAYKEEIRQTMTTNKINQLYNQVCNANQ